MEILAILKQLSQDKPQVVGAIQGLRQAVLKECSLDAKTANLVAIGIATAIRNQEALIGHIQLAKEAGATEDEVVGAILLALPSSGVPSTLTALPQAWQAFKK
ncbi:carboxymuconolactone decarboxylase family protein [Desulforamulus ferrireducens]|uniref:Carboxymuconolactone decarboxylase n=1 Tax=Desulforamulus ferrireducens TaxID=1833852 RepID=A0A1S6IUA1_9FIRM|nr:carboxymuconolactone decarboxylase family protein [Desulforamulus ferrireducens]AQS58314.1 carboxymuconolactone decarboxylase [Desulforamulus ferrireducens]